ncbi:MAG: hypothetical protein VX611_05660 [Bacteroidota bacterium]|nr:hypothetical protein [Bacteroidota bacterium]MEC8032168.1 hypothetical protein [Bacteroidota bacterium]MEC9221998.1 hypothetical protein [Bacteroidota bacterium]
MKTIYTLLITFIATATSFAQPIQCFFAISTENPREVMMATDRLMNSEFGKSLPATVALYQEAFNGEQAHTHTLGFTFQNAELMQEAWSMWFTSEEVMEWEKTINPISDNTGEWMTMPLVLEGDVSSDNVFMRWALNVTGDSNEYMKQWMKFTEGAKDRGMEMGSYGLSAVVAGVAENDMTHFVFIGAPDIPTMMQRMTKLQQDEEFKAFSARVGDIRTILHQDMIMAIGAWNIAE